jgi:hypothetical protein
MAPVAAGVVFADKLSPYLQISVIDDLYHYNRKLIVLVAQYLKFVTQRVYNVALL